MKLVDLHSIARALFIDHMTNKNPPQGDEKSVELHIRRIAQSSMRVAEIYSEEHSKNYSA